MQSKNSFWFKLTSVFLASTCVMSSGAAIGAESTMPPQYVENIKPEFAARYTYTEDGAYSKALNIPTYEWMPTGMKPTVLFLGIHGLTLHGRRFRVLARTLAVNGAGFIAMDMRGFGRCHFDDQKRFSTPDEDKTKVDHEKSYQDIVALAKMIKAQYPDVRLVALGESLGCTFCVRLAAEHPDLIMGTVLSAPAVRLNKDMYMGHGQIKQGVKALIPHHELDMSSFFAGLCSGRVEVQKEMTEDPFIRKRLSLRALISTDEFCAKTDSYGKMTSPSLSVLILQGSSDGCVSPKHVTDLMNAMTSDDQTLWRGKFGHLQLETMFMRAATVDAIGDWLLDHSHDQLTKIRGLQQNISDVGGTVSR